jgi:AmiR/NasT family two-component response regulator
MLATYAATALISVDRQTQFESALAGRDLIGQAKGILMERFHIDAERAFDMMKALSQDSNTRLRVIAKQIVDST